MSLSLCVCIRGCGIVAMATKRGFIYLLTDFYMYMYGDVLPEREREREGREREREREGRGKGEGER